MKKHLLLLLILFSVVLIKTHAEKLPLVYTVENTGASFPKPVLPTIDQLPSIGPLPDPFMWSSTNPYTWTDSTTARSTKFSDWSKRRAEIAWEIQNYEIGTKPVRPDTITASYSGGTLTVNITKNGQTMTITSAIALPSGTGPFPAIIGMNSGSGSLPSNVFSDRNIARITFSHDQVTTYNSPSNTNPFYRLYPNQNIDNSGQYGAWAWGVSRIIDGLELCKATLPIDLKHLAVTGCSYAGKMALFAGAFDERIALTIPQESGGGGVAAWRVSETIGAVEKLGSTSNQWFSEGMFSFSGTNTAKLPMDHHELCAMVAPRALLIYGNPDYGWLADQAGHVSIIAAREVWKKFGIEDRCGYTIMGGHSHCALPANQTPELIEFVDKFLLGDTTANTIVMNSKFTNVDHTRWIQWWGTNNPVFPVPGAGYDSHWIEAERLLNAKSLTKWNLVDDATASNGKYITVKTQATNLSAASNDSTDLIVAAITVPKDDSYNIFALINCATFDDDSFWMKVDNGSFVNYNGLSTGGAWLWKSFTSALLTAGEHNITICHREDGAKLDKLCITTNPYAPEGFGENDPVLFPTTIKAIKVNNGYALEQNIPNPVNNHTTIGFEIPTETHVSLIVSDLTGSKIKELADKKYTAGKHSVVFDTTNLPSGFYIYTMTAGDQTLSKKILLESN